MTTAERLTTVAENVAKVYEAGKAAGGVIPSVGEKDVNFYDYDGTCLYSYTVAEAQALTELPPLPTRKGLICQGWNWTLAKIKALGRPVDVGAVYITDDGKTRLHINIATRGRLTIPLHFSQSTSGGVTIDWGDGSEAETVSGSGQVSTSHTYEKKGDYIISLASQTGFALGVDFTHGPLGDAFNVGVSISSMLRAVNIGAENHRVRSASFYAYRAVESITQPKGITSIVFWAYTSGTALRHFTIPDGVTTIDGRTFESCQALRSISIPDGVTAIYGAFKDCRILQRVTLPDSLAIISDGAFSDCLSLTSLTIPSAVTTIGADAFANCGGMAEYHLKPTNPPALSNVGAFSAIPADCIIYVPKGSLSAYQTATNWVTYADRMQEEPT